MNNSTAPAAGISCPAKAIATLASDDLATIEVRLYEAKAVCNLMAVASRNQGEYIDPGTIGWAMTLMDRLLEDLIEAAVYRPQPAVDLEAAVRMQAEPGHA